MKIKARRLYSSAFRIFLPNVNEIDPYNFHRYTISKSVHFFLRHSVVF